MKIVEIWIGGSSYRFENVKRIDGSLDGCWCKITLDDGYEFETSPHNVLIITSPTKGE